MTVNNVCLSCVHRQTSLAARQQPWHHGSPIHHKPRVFYR